MNGKIFFLLGLSLTLYLRTSGQGFHVNHFNAEIHVHADGTLDVSEKYDINFFESKHGIIREIVTKYNFQDEAQHTEKRTLKIDRIKVLNHKFSVSPAFMQTLNGYEKIKIGDPKQLVSGDQSYHIQYRVRNAMISNDSIVQFYWNIKASEWQAVFKQINFRVILPDGAELSSDNCFTYSGFSGITKPTEEFIFQYKNGIYSGSSLPGWSSKRGENVTVLIKLPADLFAITPPSLIEPKDFIWIFLLLFTTAAFFLTWLRFGKDDSVISLTSYFPPDGVDPAMAGYLINEREDASDLVALIPKWGYDGLIEVEEIPKKGFFSRADTKLTKLGELPKDAPAYERILFNGLFAEKKKTLYLLKNIFDSDGNETKDSVLISSLKDSFYKTMAEAKTELRKSAKKYYEPSGEKAKLWSFTFSVLSLFVLTPLLLFFFGFIAAGVSAAVSVFLMAMSFFMRKKNKIGTRASSELKGFRQFIKLAKTNQIRHLLDEDPGYFEKTMSYALAFGLLKNWASKFDKLNIPPPNWYSNPGLSGTNFNGTLNQFAKSFTGSMSKTQSNMVSAPSNSKSGNFGGGSSGGGFGGGGGSSW